MHSIDTHDAAPDDREPRASTGGAPYRALLFLTLVALFAALVGELWMVAARKTYSIDEFMYAHGGWDIARGRSPYRDFIIHNSPFSYYFYALPFLFTDNSPLHVGLLRMLSLGCALVTVISVWRLSDRSRWGIVGAIVLLLSPTALEWGIEIRRDVPAVAALGMLLVVAGSALPAARKGLAVGALYAVLLWTNEKALTYAAPVPVLLLSSMYSPRLRNALGSVRWFIVGALVVSAAGVSLIAYAGALREWLEWGVRFPFIHEQYYPGFPFKDSLLRYLVRHWWLIALGTVGLVSTLRLRGAWSADELLLALLLPSCFVAFAILAAPYEYNFIPLNIVLSVFAGRGILRIVALVREARDDGPLLFPSALLGTLFLVPMFCFLVRVPKRFAEPGNTYQKSILEDLERLTTDTDPIFDSSGSSVTRPAVSRFFITNAVMREIMEPRLIEEIIGGMKEKGCVVLLYDARTRYLPNAIQSFLFANFLPYNDDIGIWGKRFRSSTTASSFTAPISGQYFVSPAKALKSGTLLIDGNAVSEQIFPLEKGEHTVSFTGDSELAIAWLPRDGRPFTPKAEFRPRFSVY